MKPQFTPHRDSDQPLHDDGPSVAPLPLSPSTSLNDVVHVSLPKIHDALRGDTPLLPADLARLEFAICDLDTNAWGQKAYLGGILEHPLFLRNNEVLQQIIHRRSKVNVDEIMILNDEAAQALANSRGDYIDLLDQHSITLQNLIAISDRQASILATYGGDRLQFGSLSRLSDAQAVAFGSFKGKGALLLNGVTEISNKQAIALSAYKGKILQLKSIRSITSNKMKALLAYCGQLYLDSIQEMTDDLASACAEQMGSMVGLSLRGITEMTDHQVKLMTSNFSGQVLEFGGLKKITDAQAKMFAATKYSLTLYADIALTEEQMEILYEKRWGLYPRALKERVEEAHNAKTK